MKLSGITLKDLTQTCSACPSQWDGMTTDGRSVYIRYRFGYLSVDISDEEVYGDYYGDSMDGFMTTNEMLEKTGIKLDL
jgi:hypothetical protein